MKETKIIAYATTCAQFTPGVHYHEIWVCFDLDMGFKMTKGGSCDIGILPQFLVMAFLLHHDENYATSRQSEILHVI